MPPATKQSQGPTPLFKPPPSPCTALNHCQGPAPRLPCRSSLSFSLRQALFVPKAGRRKCPQFQRASGKAYKQAVAAVLGLSNAAAATDGTISLDCQCIAKKMFRVTVRVETPPVTAAEARTLAARLADAAANGEVRQQVRRPAVHGVARRGRKPAAQSFAAHALRVQRMASVLPKQSKCWAVLVLGLRTGPRPCLSTTAAEPLQVAALTAKYNQPEPGEGSCIVGLTPCTIPDSSVACT